MGNTVTTGVEEFVTMTSDNTGIVKTKICVNENIDESGELYGIYPNTNLTFTDFETNDHGLFGKFNTNNLEIGKHYKILDETLGLMLPDTVWIMIKSNENTIMKTFTKPNSNEEPIIISKTGIIDFTNQDTINKTVGDLMTSALEEHTSSFQTENAPENVSVTD